MKNKVINQILQIIITFSSTTVHHLAKISHFEFHVDHFPFLFPHKTPVRFVPSIPLIHPSIKLWSGFEAQMHFIASLGLSTGWCVMVADASASVGLGRWRGHTTCRAKKKPFQPTNTWWGTSKSQILAVSHTQRGGRHWANSILAGVFPPGDVREKQLMRLELKYILVMYVKYLIGVCFMALSVARLHRSMVCDGRTVWWQLCECYCHCSFH